MSFAKRRQSCGLDRHRPKLATLAAIALAAALLTSGCSSKPPPDVILVSIDTLRADHVSVYGYSRPTTPHLEEFARDGIVFENAYAHVPFTLPSHISMLTSLFPVAHGVTKEKALSSRTPILTELLKEAGYRTWGFYAQTWLDPRFGFSRGFDVYEHKSDATAELDEVAMLLDELEVDRDPFFLFFHLREVHCTIKPGQPLYSSPPEYRDVFLPHPDHPVEHESREIWENRADLTEEEAANVVAQHDGGVLYADALVHELFEDLRSRGLWENSLVIVTSDHGESLGQRGDYMAHGHFWQEGLHVPMIVKLPDSHPESPQLHGSRLEYNVQSVDIPPTVLDTAGLPVPDVFQGRSLLDASGRDVIAHRGNVSVLVQESLKLKLVRGRNRVVELYDLSVDPEELSSLHETDPETVDRMMRVLRRRIAEHEEIRLSLDDGSKNIVEPGEEEKARLRALGY